MTIRIVRRFPKSYRYEVTNNLLTLAVDIYTNCVEANGIFIHKDMLENDFELRHRYLMIAATRADGLLGEITFAYELVDDGNNFFKNREEYERIFSGWTKQGNITLRRIRNLIDSDKRRYNSYQKAKAEATAKAEAEAKAAK